MNDYREILSNYIDQLLERSTPQAPVWNIEKVRSGEASSWNYVDGCMINALLELYSIKKEPAYLQFADDFIDSFVSDDGQIRSYDPLEYNIDNVNAGKTLFELYKLTGKEKYRKAIDTIYTQIENQPRTKEGNFWHKKIYPEQIWLDGLYMGQPFYALYELNYHDCKHVEDIYQQFHNVYQLMRNPLNGLYYHAYDSSRESFWCDKKTGLSGNAWLRALGWYAMALIDTIDIFREKPELDSYQKGLASIYRELIDAMLPYQNRENGMWCQVVNFPEIQKNYFETSGTAIFAYAIMKSVRLGILPEEYFEAGFRAFEGTCRRYLSEKDGELQLGGICLVAGLGNKEMREGTFEYYMREPVVENEAKGIAPLILAYVEVLYKEQGEESHECKRCI